MTDDIDYNNGNPNRERNPHVGVEDKVAASAERSDERKNRWAYKIGERLSRAKGYAGGRFLRKF
jgi:hypothetical protein